MWLLTLKKGPTGGERPPGGTNCLNLRLFFNAELIAEGTDCIGDLQVAAFLNEKYNLKGSQVALCCALVSAPFLVS